MLAASDAVAASASVNEDGTVALTITPHFESDADATNTITISSLTAGATLSNTLNGTLTPVGGVYTLSVAQLNGLTLHAPGQRKNGLAELVVRVPQRVVDQQPLARLPDRRRHLTSRARRPQIRNSPASTTGRSERASTPVRS